MSGNAQVSPGQIEFLNDMKNIFADDAVPLELLRERAFNMRWAQQPAGVIPLTAADPDFPVSPAILEALVRYVREGVLSYVPPEGLPAFREAVAEWLHSTRQIACSAEDVFATDSAASGMAVVGRASLQPGDEVLIPDPVDFLLHHCVAKAGAKPVYVPVTRQTSASEYVAAMEARLTPRTRMVWLCNPHNPLGVVYTREWLAKIAQWAIGKQLRILADEIWSDIVYAPHQHVSVAALGPEIAASTVTVYGFSKSFALGGMRVGFVVTSDREWRKKIVEASDAGSTVYGVAVLSQVAAIAAFREGKQWLGEFVQHLQGQRDYCVERLREWSGAKVTPPQGTYVIFPDVSALTSDTEKFCEQLREQAKVALVPGAHWFGPGAAGNVRICFATSRAILKEAFDRMQKVGDLRSSVAG